MTNKLMKEIGFIYFSFFFPVTNEYVGVAVPSEAGCVAVMLILVPQLLANTWTYYTVSGFRNIVNPSFALCQLNFPTGNGKIPSILYEV